jgi:hypothetical protein
MDAKHKKISDLKNFASELGRVPHKREYVERFRENYRLDFGNWSVFLQAAGFSGKDLAKKHTAHVIKSTVQLEREIEINRRKKENEVKRVIAPLPNVIKAKKIAVAGDTHFCFASPDALTAFYLQLEIHKPDCVVQIGDLYDAYAASKFPRSLNVMTPQAEDELSRKHAEEFWATVRRICGPDVQCFQILGNHDVRAHKRLMETWPEGEHLIRDVLAERFKFEGVHTISDPTQELVINDIVFIHGHYSKLGAHRDYFGRNVVTGHSHRGGVDYRAYGDQVLFEANAGYLGDPYSKALSYRHTRIHNWTHGCLIIDEHGPKFIAF